MTQNQRAKLNQIVNHGLIIDKVQPENYVSGAFTKVPKIVLQPDGQWIKFLPADEKQNINGIETFSCASFGTLNALEILFNRQFKLKENYADRYLAIASGTTNRGNSPQTVSETLRKDSGCIDENLLPFSDDIKTFEQYQSPNPLPDNLINKGKKWLAKYVFMHEWVFQGGDNKIEKLKENLQYSPIGISVCAWDEYNGLYIKPEGYNDNHWVVGVGYKEPEYWLVLDTYPNSDGIFLKKLVWDYDFQMAKRYYIAEKKTEEKVGFWIRLLNWFRNICLK